MAAGEILPPYIISRDVYPLLKQWAETEGSEYTIPSEAYVDSLSEELYKEIHQATGSKVIIVHHEETKEGLERLAANSDLPVISLDRAYLSANTPGVAGFIDGTRGVDENLTKLEGLIPRPGHRMLSHQYESLRTADTSPVVLADDVVFEGGTILEHIDALAKVNRPVVKVFAGIAIKEGIDRLREENIEVEAVLEYDEVIDEVCERDFFGGSSMSGRTVVSPDGTTCYSAPYFEPLGNAQAWASIPAESVRSFSKLCIRNSISLWTETKTKSGLSAIEANRLPRRIRLIDGPQPAANALEDLLIRYSDEDLERI